MKTVATQGRRALPLKIRLGLGAAMLGTGAVLTALILYLGLNEVAARLDTALASEKRMVRYATLSQQASTLLVVATEVVQTGQPAQVRRDRIEPVTLQLGRTFAALRADVQAAVEEARTIGIDAQSRYGTQSLGLARMEAMLASTVDGLRGDTDDAVRLRAYIDSFAASFDSLLSQAVNTEILFRTAILSGIADLRRTLTLSALAIAALTLLAVIGFHFGLIRPLFARLDGLRDAALRIGREDFDITLPVTRRDEIGLISAETNRAAAALAERRDRVQAEWARLNDTIAQRTQELRNANAALEEIDENRRRFFADVSHELRTPLTVILMEAQIGRKQHPEAETFATIEARAARLNRRIDDLLRVARSDSGKLELDPQPTDLAAVVDGAIAEVRAEIAGAGMTLERESLADARLRCDPNWVRQVVVSLIRNAIRHARDGGYIGICATRQTDTASIAVIDHGPGILPGDRDRVFDRFGQGSGAAKAQGFGVGLALARWVIEAQGGTIEVISPLPREAGQDTAPGTKVEICLPLATQ